jgi:hypothetical protein
MNKQQTLRYINLWNTLHDLGLTSSELDTLLRCQKSLHTWAYHECNGAIQRDEETNIPSWHNTYSGKRIARTADRETGALKRAAAIAKAHGLTIYHQTDPRGCSLYIIRPGDVPEGTTVDCCYSNGIAVCID